MRILGKTNSTFRTLRARQKKIIWEIREVQTSDYELIRRNFVHFQEIKLSHFANAACFEVFM